jgi:hypothetical protein
LTEARAVLLLAPPAEPRAPAHVPLRRTARRRGLSNRLFFACLLASSLSLSAVSFAPVLGDAAASWAGADLARTLHLVAKPSHRTRVRKLVLGWAALAILHYVLCLRERRRRGLRTAALALAALYNAALVPVSGRIAEARRVTAEVARGDYFDRQWPHFRRLDIVQYPSAGLADVDWRRALRPGDLASFAELHCRLVGLCPVYEERLKREWGLQDPAELRALFFMNVVSGFWAFGNKAAVDRPGGALANEDNGWQPQPPSARAYLASRVGCCTDYAYLLKSLLDHEGLENRLTCIPGHAFNEVKLHGRWRILDPTTGLFVDAGWDDLYADGAPGDSRVRVVMFRHPGLAGESSCRYRPVAGSFRLLMLTRLANRPAFFSNATHPGLPPCFD